jgi:hypothetical protein
MKTKLIIVLTMGLLTLALYLCKDFMLATVPDGDYSERVIRNKEIFIGILAVVGFTSLYLIRRFKKK